MFNRLLYKIENESLNFKLYDSNNSLPDVIEYIQDNFTDPNISVEYLSKLCGTSTTYFRKIFAENLGVSPLKYINSLRVEYATELLKTGYYSIATVAELVGFSDPNYFSSFISKNTGHYPSFFLKRPKT